MSKEGRYSKEDFSYSSFRTMNDVVSVSLISKRLHKTKNVGSYRDPLSTSRRFERPRLLSCRRTSGTVCENISRVVRKETFVSRLVLVSDRRLDQRGVALNNV